MPTFPTPVGLVLAFEEQGKEGVRIFLDLKRIPGTLLPKSVSRRCSDDGEKNVTPDFLEAPADIATRPSTTVADPLLKAARLYRLLAVAVLLIPALVIVCLFSLVTVGGPWPSATVVAALCRSARHGLRRAETGGRAEGPAEPSRSPHLMRCLMSHSGLFPWLLVFAVPFGLSAQAAAPSTGTPETPAERERVLLEQAERWEAANRLRTTSGERDATRKAAEQTLALERVLFGPATPVRVYLLQWLAREFGQDRTPAAWAQAERYRDEAVAAQRQLLSNRPQDQVASLRRQQREQFRQAVAVREKVLGRDNWLVGQSLVGLALAQEACGDEEQARASLEQALARFKASPREWERALGPWTDAHFHLRRLQLRAGVMRGDRRESAPADLSRRLEEALGQAREAERLEASPNAERARLLWGKVLYAAQNVLWDSGKSCSVRVQLDLAARARPVFDRYLSFARRARPSAQEAGQVYDQHFAPLKGSVFVQQRRVCLERRHPALRPFFDVLQEVNERLARLEALKEPSGSQLRDLLILKSALEGEMGRRWALLPARQTGPPSLFLPAHTVLVDYRVYEDSPLLPEAGQPAAKPPHLRLACFISHSLKSRKVEPKEKGKPLGTSPRAVAYLDLGPLEPVTEALVAWRRAIEHGRGGPNLEATSPAFVLRKRLWEPLATELVGTDVVLISPDGPLCALPFAALPGSKPNSYLIEETHLAVAPTPQLLDSLKGQTEFLAGRDSLLYTTEPRKVLAQGPLLVGDIQFGSVPGRATVLSPLPGTAREIERVGDLFAMLHVGSVWRPGATCLSRDRATVAAVRGAMGQHRWIHLATHGYWEAGEGQEPELHSALVLAGANSGPEKRSGILSAFEVSGLDLERTELVVLSACETGLGRAQEGQGVLGLQRAFQVAGARSVIASLWSVPDEATQALMGRLYSNLWQRRLPRLEALREAQLWLLREGSRRPGVVRGMVRKNPGVELARGAKLPPLAWAAFILSGEWRTVGDESMITIPELSACLAFSPDGKILASGGRDIKLWEVRTGENTATLTGHTGLVTVVSFSPDGKTLASGGDDKSIKLWEVRTGKNTATFTGHTGVVTAVSFSPDGKTLALGGPDGVKLWDVGSGKKTATFAEHAQYVSAVSLSPNGKVFASADNTPSIKLWDLASGKNAATLAGSNRPLRFSPDGTTLASGGGNTSIKLWDVRSGENIAILPGSCTCLAYSPDGKTLASGGDGWDIKLWDVLTRKNTVTLSGHGAAVGSLAFSPDGKTLASGSYGSIKLWDMTVPRIP
jgi:CHAT domain-containing protein/Tol biopolymer transport system component/tetratricopeptide (TPR) repeat protein